jgi:predicted tellurium resistance membrane protein TerC
VTVSKDPPEQLRTQKEAPKKRSWQQIALIAAGIVILVMVIALIAAIGVMLIAAKPISDFVDAHPTIKMLALSFLILVGVTLIVEGFDVHVPKGYIYFSMVFSVAVEMLNLRLRKKQQPKPVKLYKTISN